MGNTAIVALIGMGFVSFLTWMLGRRSAKKGATVESLKARKTLLDTALAQSKLRKEAAMARGDAAKKHHDAAIASMRVYGAELIVLNKKLRETLGKYAVAIALVSLSIPVGYTQVMTVGDECLGGFSTAGIVKALQAKASGRNEQLLRDAATVIEALEAKTALLCEQRSAERVARKSDDIRIEALQALVDAYASDTRQYATYIGHSDATIRSLSRKFPLVCAVGPSVSVIVAGQDEGALGLGVAITCGLPLIGR